MNIPARPGVIIRAPEREETKDKENNDFRTGSRKKQPRILTIYTNSKFCPFGNDLLDLANKKGLKYVEVDVTFATPPSWLPGTPSVTYADDVYCGDAAFSFVESLRPSNLDERGHQTTTTPTTGGAPTQHTQHDLASSNTDSGSGCGIKAAFAKPRDIEVDESMYAQSTEDKMQKLLAERR